MDNSTPIFIGNVVMLFGAVFLLLSGIAKDNKSMIKCFIVETLIYTVGSIFLFTFPGFINNLSSCIRNVLCYKDKLKAPAKIMLAVISIGLTICCNNLGVLGYLPLVSTLLYIIFIDVKSIVVLRCINILSSALWIIHDIYVMSYVTVGIGMAYLLINLFFIAKTFRLLKLGNVAIKRS